MNAVGAFFASLGPSDYVTSAIAIGALVVSIVAIVQAHRGVPKPRLEITAEWDYPRVYTGDDEEPIYVEPMEVAVANHGNGTAHDVKVLVPARKKPVVDLSLGAIPADERRTVSFNLLDLPSDSGKTLDVTWWEHPPRRGRKHRTRHRY